MHPGFRTGYLRENISQTKDEAYAAGRAAAVVAVHYLRLPSLRPLPAFCRTAADVDDGDCAPLAD
ncbi:hypothetical protein CRT23_19395 [Methylobacterium sp. V23]|nr:hypothetical protein CRT23_19395 [Methylobacterium sp. V23]